MRKIIASILMMAFLASQTMPVLAMKNAAGAAEDYFAAVQRRISANQKYRADLDVYNANKTPENEQKAVVSGKAMLNSWLDEAQAWLIWKNLQAKENPDVPSDLKNAIQNDVNTNLEKINQLRNDVASVKTLNQGVAVFLMMVQKYIELLVDVARNTGAVWVVAGNKILDTADSYEAKLRIAAQAKNNSAAIALLNSAKSSLQTARTNVQTAANYYKKTVIGGNPLINFSQGNVYINQARVDLLTAESQMAQAFSLIVSSQQQ